MEVSLVWRLVLVRLLRVDVVDLHGCDACAIQWDVVDGRLRFGLIRQDVWEEHNVDGRRTCSPRIAEYLLGIAVERRQLWATGLSREDGYGYLLPSQT